MAILIVGGSGFLGRRIALALEAAGHAVVRGKRPAIDLARDVDPAAWGKHLQGIDAVVNAAGIFRERPGAAFEAIHVRGPVALFRACAAAGIPVVQVSALGADDQAASAFHRSKRDADRALLALDVPSVVLQPSLVFGAGGASARLFAMLASLPWIPLPAGGRQKVQPVHVDDVAAAVVAIVERAVFPRRCVAVVGPQPLALRDYLAALRSGLGLGRARFMTIPGGLARLAAKLRLGWLDADSLAMLERGNVADPGPLAALLGREPRAVRDFIPDEFRAALRARAQLDWLRPVLRAALAATWFAAAIVSAGLYPVERSYALLAQAGITGALAPVALHGAVALDFALGLATLMARRARALWLAQAVLVLGYTAIVTIGLPEQWLHPFGPMVKNLPILAILALLYATEER